MPPRRPREKMWTCWQNQGHSQPNMGPIHKRETATITKIIRGGKERKQTGKGKHITRGITRIIQEDSR